MSFVSGLLPEVPPTFGVCLPTSVQAVRTTLDLKLPYSNDSSLWQIDIKTNHHPVVKQLKQSSGMGKWEWAGREPVIPLLAYVLG